MTTWDETTTLFSASGGGGYDWSVIEIISRPHGDTVQYAVYDDGGCSCDHERMDALEEYNLEWMFDFMDARREAENLIRSVYNRAFTDAEKAEYLSELRMIKP